MAKNTVNIPVYGDNIGAFIKSESPFLKNTGKTTNIEQGITTLPVGTLIKITQGEVKRVVSPFKVLVTGFSGDVMHIVFGIKNSHGEMTLEGTVTF